MLGDKSACSGIKTLISKIVLIYLTYLITMYVLFYRVSVLILF